jgi:hypothetical protein
MTELLLCARCSAEMPASSLDRGLCYPCVVASAQAAQTETWRPVPGHEGRYEVSDQGAVRSLRYSNAAVDRPRQEPLLLRAGRASAGYQIVTLLGKTTSVHRIVLEAFIGPCPDHHQCAHLNGVRTDNRLVNLQWVTARVNGYHRRLHGTSQRGDLSPARRYPESQVRGARVVGAKLTEASVLVIRRALARGERRTALAEQYRVSEATISAIAAGRKWAHVRLPAHEAGRLLYEKALAWWEALSREFPTPAQEFERDYTSVSELIDAIQAYGRSVKDAAARGDWDDLPAEEGAKKGDASWE